MTLSHMALFFHAHTHPHTHIYSPALSCKNYKPKQSTVIYAMYTDSLLKSTENSAAKVFIIRIIPSVAYSSKSFWRLQSWTSLAHPDNLKLERLVIMLQVKHTHAYFKLQVPANSFGMLGCTDTYEIIKVFGWRRVTLVQVLTPSD